MITIDCITIQALCHATEREDRVLHALQYLYPVYKKETATGYFNNPIHVFTARITRKKEIKTVVQLLQSTIVINDVRRRMDKKGNLYIRLDKQKLYSGIALLKDSGEIKIIIHVQSYPFRLEDAIQYAQTIFSH